jgi:hypothetical protein
MISFANAQSTFGNHIILLDVIRSFASAEEGAGDSYMEKNTQNTIITSFASGVTSL